MLDVSYVSFIIAAMQRAFGPGRRKLSRTVCLAMGLLISAQLACANSPDKLPPPYKQFYYNLPSEAQKTEYLKLDDSQREPYLKQTGLWDKWTALPAEERKAAMQGDVKVGFHEFAAFMAWGPPANSQGSNDRTHTYIRCSSGPKRGKYVINNLDCDGTSSEIELTIQDDVIVEIKYLN
ncbi:MAG: hypothetical protein H6713_09315 [Myxococcales bacterium]|nr:hypothetical protein [Myxococcales bacterium]MCB9750186.1 hypothetical protein [Myxococcales bacterium]